MYKIKCDMELGCKHPVEYLDIKGFVYCKSYGLVRKQYMRCRKLTAREVKQLNVAKPI